MSFTGKVERVNNINFFVVLSPFCIGLWRFGSSHFPIQKYVTGFWLKTGLDPVVEKKGKPDLKTELNVFSSALN